MRPQSLSRYTVQIVTIGLLVLGTVSFASSASAAITWTDRTAAEDNIWLDVAYGDGTFVAVSANGTNRVMISTDGGATWSSQSAAEANQWKSVAYGAGLFVAVADSGTNRVMTSPDGITWTARSASSAANWNVVEYVNGIFIAGSTQSGSVMTSANGTSWTGVSSGATAHWQGFAYGASLYVGVTGSDGQAVLTSPTGATWTQRTVPDGTEYGWDGVVFGEDIFVAVTGNANYAGESTLPYYAFTSPDGITWTGRSSLGESVWRDVTHGGTVFVAVSQDSEAKSSVDGITWVTDTVPSGGYYGVTSDGTDSFVAVGHTGAVMTGEITVIVVPTVTTQSASSVSVTTATANGNITATGGESATTRGVAYGTSSTLSGGDTATSSASGTFSTGAFTRSLTGLTCNTTYYTRAFATNSAGTGYGAISSSFTTSACATAPTVTTSAASSVTQTTATANGTISATGGATPTTRGFAYGTVSNLSTVVATTSASGSFSTGAYTGSLTSLSCGTTYYIRAYATNSAGTGFGSIQSFDTSSCDTDAPAISSASVSIATTTATITWTTDEAASSRVRFGPSSSLGTSTALFDTSPRVTSHSVSLSGLLACRIYHYQIESIDANSNTATASTASFRTLGCTTNASVQAEQASNIATSTGGSVTQANLTLSVPVGFSNASSTITFQASQLEGSTFFASVPAPSGKRTVGSSVFTLSALSDATTTVSSFDSALTISFSYQDSDVVGVDESSLVIYRYDGSAWHALTGCTVNTTANTISCTTTQFSDFALLGEPIGNGPVYSGGASSLPGYSSPSPTVILSNTTTTPTALTASGVTTDTATILASLLAQLEVLRLKLAQLQGTAQTPTTTFSRNLELNMAGDDVRALQQFLNAKGFLIAEEGEGSPGNEVTLFGMKTYHALVKFQISREIFPATGFFGPVTRGVVNAE